MTGLRRTGKTSLMKVALNEAGVYYVYVDVRLSLYANYRDMVELFVEAINDFLHRRSSIMDKIINIFRGVKGLRASLNPPGISVKFRGDSRLILPIYSLGLMMLASRL